MIKIITIVGAVLLIVVAKGFCARYQAADRTVSQKLKALLIKVDVEEKPNLFILLAADGSINRMGTGAMDNTDKDMYIGIVKEPLFNELRSKVQMNWFDKYRSFTTEKSAGKQCKLLIMAQSAQGREAGMQFLYGSESTGLPTEIADFIQNAIAITDPWYTKQQEMVKSQSGT